MINQSFVARFDNKDDNDEDETTNHQRNVRDIGTLPPCEVLASSGNTDASELNFDRVAGLEMEKERIRSAFARPNLAPLMYTDVPRGMLLYGPPGTGKTYLMRAFVHEMPHAILVGPDTSQFQSSYYGVPTKLIRYFFECTSKAAYANDRAEKIALGTTIGLLFIDELEAIARSRNSAGTENDNQRGAVVATILQLLQGVRSDFPNVYLVGATNLPWTLDTALLSRMPVRIFFNIPDAPARAEIINTIMRRMYTPIEYTSQFTPKPDEIEELKSGAAPSPIVDEKSDELAIYDRASLLKAIDPTIPTTGQNGKKRAPTNEAADVAAAVFRVTNVVPPLSIADIRSGRRPEAVDWKSYTLTELADYILGTLRYNQDQRNGQPYQTGRPLSNPILSFVGQKLRARRETKVSPQPPPPTILIRRTPPAGRVRPTRPVDRYVLDNLWKLCLPYLEIGDIEPQERKTVIESKYSTTEDKTMEAYNTALENTFMTYLLNIPVSLEPPNPNDPIRAELRRRRLTVDAFIRSLVQMSGPQTENQVRARLSSTIRNARILEQLITTYRTQRGSDMNANGAYLFGYSARDLTQAIEQGINLASDRTFVSGVRPCDPLTPNCFQKYGACTATTVPSSICVSVSRLDPIDRSKLQNFSLKAADMFTAFDRVRSTVVPSEYVDYLWYDKNQEKLPTADASSLA